MNTATTTTTGAVAAAVVVKVIRKNVKENGYIGETVVSTISISNQRSGKGNELICKGSLT